MKTKVATMFILSFLFVSNVVPNSHVKRGQVELVESMISKLKPNLNTERTHSIAMAIVNASLKYNIDPRVIIAIIDTESDFRKGMISYTGDLSLVQINPGIWNKEFKRMNRELLDTDKLQKNENYAIEKMGEILNILKVRYAGADSKWFARYHSKTKKFKNIYHSKVESRLITLASL